MPQRSVATNFTFEQQRQEINLLAADFWTHKGDTDTAAPTYLKHDGSNNFTGQTLNVPNAFTINSNSGNGTLTISGNLDVTGTTTTVSTANLEVTDKNILIAKGSTSDAQADGAGITIDSATDITFNFVDAKDALVSSVGLEGTTFLKAPYGQFIGSGVPSGGQGVEINAPDTNTGQIISYDRANTAYKELRVKGSSVGVYTGTTNALVGSFNSTGLAMESGKTITSGNITISTDTDASFFINTTNANGAHLRIQTSGTNKTFLGQAAGIAGTLGGADDFAIRSAEDIVFSTNNNNTPNVKIDTSGQFGLNNTSPDVWNTSYTSLQIYDAAVLYGSSDDSFVGLGANHYLNSGGNFIYSNSDFASRFYQVNGDFYFESASSGSAGGALSFTERLRLENDGKLIQDANTTGTVCYFKNNNTTDGFGLRIEGGGTTADRYALAVFNAAGSEKFRVNADGNIGIGAAQPATILHVRANTGDMLRLDRDNQGAVGNQISFRHKDAGSAYVETCSINAVASTNAVDGNLRFYTKQNGGSNREVMRLDQAGTLSLKGDTDTYLDHAGTNTWQVVTNGNLCTEFSANQRVRMPQVYSTNGSSMNDVQIESDGTLCAGNTSIRASKKNIASQTDVSWLYDLNPVTFNYRKKLVDKDTGEHTYLEEAESETAYGLIAEEVETVNKDFCFYNDDKLAGVYYKQLITPLLKALQDQKKEIETLKTKVESLS